MFNDVDGFEIGVSGA